MAIILFEGIDKSGKSTLLSDFKFYLDQENIAYDSFKNKIKPVGKSLLSIGRTSGIYLGAYQLASRLTLFDRSHITEIVYSNRRGYEALDYIKWLKYEQQFDMLLIYLHAPAAVIEKRFKEDKEDYISKEEIEGIMSRYSDYILRTKLKTLILSSLDKREENLTKLIEFIKRWTSLKSKITN